MATWIQTGPNRWKLEPVDEKGKKRDRRHILIAKNGHLIELHDRTAHVYEPDGPIDPAQPLANVRRKRTVHRQDLAGGKGKNDKQATGALEELAAEPVPTVPAEPEEG